MKYKYIVFDFNGTIIDDVDLCLDLLNDILSHQNKPNKTKEEYKEIFTFPIKKYYELAGVDFNLDTFEDLASDFIKKYQPRSMKCNLYPNAISTFNSLKTSGYKIIVLSASKLDNLCEQLKNFDIYDYFDAVLGLDNIHAASKLEIARNYFNNEGINTKEVLFIGDTLHDYEVAKAVGADIVLVSDGHQSKNVLKEANTKIIKNISYINSILEE